MTLALAFERPQALWALLLAVPLVLLHLYRRRRRRIEVAFAPLLAEIAGPTAALSALKRLLDAANLAARLAALACLVLAAAGPREAEGAAPVSDLVVVLDGDVTTLAREARNETRFQREVALARARLEAPTVRRVAVVFAGAVPRAVVAPTADKDAAVAALAGLAPGVETADLKAALAVARTAAASLQGARILAISSRPVPGEDADPLLTVLGAGTASDDQGIVDERVVPAPDGARWTLGFTVRNYAREARTRSVVVSWADGRAFERREATLPARGTADVRFDVLPPKDGAFVTARLEGADAFASNDLAAAWLSPFPRPSVLVVHAGKPRPFVAAVLAAMGDSIDRERSGWVPRTDFAAAPPRDVTVFDGVAPPTGSWREGAYVVLAPFGDPAAWGEDAPFRPGRSVVEPLVWRAEEGHPLLRGVDLSTAYVAKGTTIAAGGAAAGLAFVEGDPVVAEGERGAVRWIAFGLDPEGSDLPLRAALPVLVKNAIRRLATAPTAPMRPFYRAGEQLRPRLPIPGEGPFVLEMREASAAALRASVPRLDPDSDAPAAPRGPPRSIEVRVGDRVVARTASVDLDPARDITPVREASTPPAPGAGPSRGSGQAAGTDPGGGIAEWLLALAGALLLADLALAAFRTTKVARAAGVA